MLSKTTKQSIIVFDVILFFHSTLFNVNCCGEANGLELLSTYGVPVVVGGVNVFAISRPCSRLVATELCPVCELDDVEVILQTETAFLRYFQVRDELFLWSFPLRNIVLNDMLDNFFDDVYQWCTYSSLDKYTHLSPECFV